MEYRNLEVKDIQPCWSCNSKGHNYEVIGRYKITNIPFIEYEGNAINYFKWLKTHNKNSYDGIITLPNKGKIYIEYKFRHCNRVYHSWVMKDWLPRKADIIVTNNKNVISYQDKRLLESNHKKLMTLSELIVYIGKFVRNILHPSKYTNMNYENIDALSMGTSGNKIFYDRLTDWKDKYKQRNLETVDDYIDMILEIIHLLV